MTRFFRALLRPFRGGARGATLVEYLVVTGFIALFAILAFNRFGRTLHRAYQKEAEHVQGRGIPGAADLLSGALNGVCSVQDRLCVQNSGYCFAAETPVFTETGDRPIQSITPGDRVWGRAETTGAIALGRVVRTWITERVPVITLELELGPGRERIRVTPGHRFFVEERGWLRADELAGLSLFSPDLALMAAPLTSALEFTTVYNFEVERYHSYFVGRSHVLVHNQQQGDDPRACPADAGVPGAPPPRPKPKLLRRDPDKAVLHCGDLGTYGVLTGQRLPQGAGALERDHVPQKAVMRARMELRLFNRVLTAKERRELGGMYQLLLGRVDRAGYAIAIPREAHTTISPTHSESPSLGDIRDPAGAARRDVEAMRGGLAKYASKECVDAYSAASEEILQLTNADYDERIQGVIETLTPQELEELRQKFDEL